MHVKELQMRVANAKWWFDNCPFDQVFSALEHLRDAERALLLAYHRELWPGGEESVWSLAAATDDANRQRALSLGAALYRQSPCHSPRLH